MWLQHLGVVLDLVVKVLSGSVPLVTGKMSWRPAEDSSSYTSDELEYLNLFQAVLLWIDAERAFYDRWWCCVLNNFP